MEEEIIMRCYISHASMGIIRTPACEHIACRHGFNSHACVRNNRMLVCEYIIPI